MAIITKKFVPVPFVGTPSKTVVDQPGVCTIQEMEQRVRDTREKHGETLQKFHEVWYECGHTWVYTNFLGIGTMKSTTDLWAYHDLMTLHRPKTVIETGTYKGGSALWFAFLMEALRIDGKVLTVDRDDHRACSHPRITFLGGDSRDPVLVAALKEQIEYPLLVSLDSDHSEQHVYDELCLYAPLCEPGDYLVVEDTNIGWVGEEHKPVVIDYGGLCECNCGKRFYHNENVLHKIKCPEDKGDRGAQGGVERYLIEHPNEFRQDILCERYLLTMHPGGWLQRMEKCSHA